MADVEVTMCYQIAYSYVYLCCVC